MWKGGREVYCIATACIAKSAYTLLCECSCPSPTVVPGYYFSGDGALRDEDGDYRITGRVDDMINSKGHRIGTAELECAMVRTCRNSAFIGPLSAKSYVHILFYGMVYVSAG